MKLNVKLTADELQNVLDAATNEALDNGLLYDDNEDDMSCLFAAVDAALTAMGIEISEDVEDDEDIDWDEDEDEDDWGDEFGEEEEEEEDDPIADMVYELNGKAVISKENATMLLEMITDVVLNDDRIPAHLKGDAVQNIFLNFCKDKGIWGVDNRD
jgi:hypothetical protein